MVHITYLMHARQNSLNYESSNLFVLIMPTRNKRQALINSFMIINLVLTSQMILFNVASTFFKVFVFVAFFQRPNTSSRSFNRVIDATSNGNSNYRQFLQLQILYVLYNIVYYEIFCIDPMRPIDGPSRALELIAHQTGSTASR